MLDAAAALLPSATDEPGARAVFAALGIPDMPSLWIPTRRRTRLSGGAESGIVRNRPQDRGRRRRARHRRRTTLRAPSRECEPAGRRITGFIVQPMARGVAEAIIGYRRDPLVGPVVALGAGGVLAEIYRDVDPPPAPVGETEAMEMIARSKASRPPRLPEPARGHRLRSHAPSPTSPASPASRGTEAEINPLIIQRDGVVMADALLRSAA